ncbi:MAG: hypothetical protein PXX82_05160 [Methanomassiliicoccales archaeon]|nr:hypothetical protein [Methanomassiliicoccales archaeon]
MNSKTRERDAINQEGRNIKLVGHSDVGGCPNGGQIAVRRRGGKHLAFVSHMSKKGFSIVDVTDPREPDTIAQTPVTPGTHSHKLRVYGRHLFLNQEQDGNASSFRAGLSIYDISDLKRPEEVHFYETGGTGVHRFWIDEKEKRAYLTTGMDGYRGRILVILDVSEPQRPREISRWWMHGQWESGGESFGADNGGEATAHGPPIPYGNYIFLGYWDGGTVVLDRTDLRNLTLVSNLNFFPSYGGNTHTALPVQRTIMGRKWLVVTDESMHDNCREGIKALWLIDRTHPSCLVPVSTFQILDSRFCKIGGRFGPHNVHEDTKVTGNLIYVTWFNAGLRVIDISNPYIPREVAFFIPETPSGQKAIQTNDLTLDSRGFIYTIDRLNGGMHILKADRSIFNKRHPGSRSV